MKRLIVWAALMSLLVASVAIGGKISGQGVIFTYDLADTTYDETPTGADGAYVHRLPTLQRGIQSDAIFFRLLITGADTSLITVDFVPSWTDVSTPDTTSFSYLEADDAVSVAGPWTSASNAEAMILLGWGGGASFNPSYAYVPYIAIAVVETLTVGTFTIEFMSISND